MGTRKMGSRFAAGVGALLALLGLGVLSLSGVAEAGKPPPPPPPPGTVYYWSSGSAWRMASDGSGKTAQPVNLSHYHNRLSDQAYGGHLQTVCTEVVSGSYPDGSPHLRLVMSPVDVAGTPFQVLNDPSVKPWKANFRPGPTPRITYSAVVYGPTAPIAAGLYEVTVDLANATVSSPVCLLAGPYVLIGDTVTEYVSQIQGHDWLDEYTLVYGDETRAQPGPGVDNAQIYLGDVRTPGTHTALIAANQPRMNYGPFLNPSGTRVLYFGVVDASYGMYEVTTGGNATPLLWVAETRKVRPQGTPDYLDDNTVVYETWTKSVYPYVFDVYRKARGQSAVNLTADVSSPCNMRGLDRP